MKKKKTKAILKLHLIPDRVQHVFVASYNMAVVHLVDGEHSCLQFRVVIL